ncbi:MAG: hypothetical protein WBO04_08490, partial [Steroidobacteraceae bacterium]
QTISAGSGTIKYDSSTWWVANLAKRIAQGGGSVYSEFWYGAGRERIRQFAQKSASTSEATTYVGGLYEKFTRTVSGTPATEHVHYVRGAGPAVAIVKRAAGTLQTRPQKAFAQATSFNLGLSPALAASRTSKSRLKELIFPRLMSDTRA